MYDDVENVGTTTVPEQHPVRGSVDRPPNAGEIYHIRLACPYRTRWMCVTKLHLACGVLIVGDLLPALLPGRHNTCCLIGSTGFSRTTSPSISERRTR